MFLWCVCVCVCVCVHLNFFILTRFNAEGLVFPIVASFYHISTSSNNFHILNSASLLTTQSYCGGLFLTIICFISPMTGIMPAHQMHKSRQFSECDLSLFSSVRVNKRVFYMYSYLIAQFFCTGLSSSSWCGSSSSSFFPINHLSCVKLLLQTLNTTWLVTSTSKFPFYRLTLQLVAPKLCPYILVMEW